MLPIVSDKTIVGQAIFPFRRWRLGPDEKEKKGLAAHVSVQPFLILYIKRSETCVHADPKAAAFVFVVIIIIE